MFNVFCQACGSNNLVLDEEECKKNHFSVYRCDDCSVLYKLENIGVKPVGWRTKKKLDEKKFFDSIPF